MNTREELAGFRPRREFFIGIDSDGTAFDSMNIKHKQAFIPAALKAWDFGNAAGEFQKLMEHINLYSESRGCNRFIGLLAAFDMLERNTGPETKFNTAPLREFVKKSDVLSNNALAAWMKEKPAPFLDDVYRWSLEADRLFGEHTRGLLPFVNVVPAIKLMAENADIMVVSSASGKGLDKDWGYSGLAEYTALIAGQELGSKKDQLSLGSSGKYPPEKVLMVGDAPSDLDAATAVGASFYPISPGKEEESWLRLLKEGLPKFFSGSYRGVYEQRLIADFRNGLESSGESN